MVYTAVLSYHSDVRVDLESIQRVDMHAHSKLVALLRQLKADERLAEKLLDHGFGADRTEEFSASKWLKLWNTGKDLWRLKFWNLENLGLRYRVIYVYLPIQARFVVMAITARGDFDYDNDDDPLRRRILASLARTYGIR